MGSNQDLAALRTLQASLNDAFEKHFKLAESQDEKGAIDSKDQLIGLSQVLLGTLGGPMGAVLQLTGSGINFMAVRMAVDWNVFSMAASKPVTLEEITSRTGADATLVTRILRLVCAIGYLKQTKQTEYSATPITHAMTIPGIRDWVKTYWDVNMKIITAFPDWARKHEWKASWADDNDNVSVEALGSLCWTYFEKNPDKSADFDSAMSIQEAFPPEMTPVYPFDSADLEPQGVTLVDVGGGRGQAIGKIRQRFPGLTGKFILQDLPKTIDQISAGAAKEMGFEPMVHDFFTEQPIKGAKFYLLRRVLHDWNDAACLRILKALRPAMLKTRDSSKLLIEDFVLPEMNCLPHEAVIDLLMMTAVDGKERTRTDWDALLGEAGFKIIKIYPALHMSTAVIEAEVA